MAQMPRSILISEGDSPLGAILARLFVSRGARVALTVGRPGAGEGRRGDLGAERAEARTVLSIPWNRRSPLSARTVLLDALNAHQAIDEILILEPACPGPALLGETGSADIERAFDDARGPVFLAREAITYFQRRGGGVLFMVSGGPAASPLENGMRECFRGVCGALLGTGGVGGLILNGFQSGGVPAEEYAAFIDRTLEEKARKISGRWFTCAPRAGFLRAQRRADLQ
jgi:NAD(P)-dependent dehydrogenase (short-subunit alcohol dehydrogenase family)